MINGHSPELLESRFREMNLTSSYCMISDLIIKVLAGVSQEEC